MVVTTLVVQGAKTTKVVTTIHCLRPAPREKDYLNIYRLVNRFALSPTICQLYIKHHYNYISEVGQLLAIVLKKDLKIVISSYLYRTKVILVSRPGA